MNIILTYLFLFILIIIRNLEELSNIDNIHLKAEICLNLKPLINIIDNQLIIDLNTKLIEENNSKIKISSIDNLITFGKSGVNINKYKAFVIQILKVINNDDAKEVKTHLLEYFSELLSIYMQIYEIKDLLGEMFIKLIKDTDKDISLLLITKLHKIIEILSSTTNSSSNTNLSSDINSNDEDILENILRELSTLMEEHVLVVVKSNQN